MSKRSVFTTITPLPAGISRETVMAFLHDHYGMIDLNPLVTDRSRCEPPDHATEEQRKCLWYSITDKISYLPGGLAEGAVKFNASFHDLPNGLQTHVFAPMGVKIKGKWTLGGSLPGEQKETVELGLGLPKEGLYLREDVDLKCNMLMTAFVKKDLKKSHEVLVDTLIKKAHEREKANPPPKRPDNHPQQPSYASQHHHSHIPHSRSQSTQSSIPSSYYGEEKGRPAPQQHYQYSQDSNYSQNSQASHSQSSFQSAQSHQTPHAPGALSQQSFQPVQTPPAAPQRSQHSYPYPQPHHQQQWQQQQRLPPQQHDQSLPAELGTPDNQSSQMPAPLRTAAAGARTGSPHRPAEMQG